MITSSSSLSQLSWLQSAILLAFFTIFYTAMVSCSKTNIPYSEHCGSIVLPSIPSSLEFTAIPFPPNQDGYYFGGDGIVHLKSSQDYFSPSNRKVLLFRLHHVYGTSVDDVYKIEASLILQTSGMNSYVEDVVYSYSYSPQVIFSGSQNGPLSFEVEGFWSNSTGKLCMVGSSSIDSEEGKPRVLAALLKLNDVKSSSSITSLVRGTLESLSFVDNSTYFEPISLLMFPKMNYKYTEVTKDFDHVCAGGIDVPVPKNMSLSLPLSKPICSVLLRLFNSFKLEYSNSCNSTKSCNPFGEGVGYLPRVMSLSVIQCSDDGRRLRFLLEFPNSSYVDFYQPFNPNSTLIAEGSWDAKKNQLCTVACRIFNTTNSLNSSHVHDCSIRLNLRFPAIWSIGNTTGIVGHIWSNRSMKDSIYFDTIMFQSHGNEILGIPGLKYQYTMVDKARDSCPKEKPSRNEVKVYPDKNSHDLQFDMSVMDSRGRRIGWGYSKPIFVGDQIRAQTVYVISSSSNMPANSPFEAKSRHSSPLNISYEMSLTIFSNASSKENVRYQVSAEGIYDVETGVVCMVGCKYPDSDNQMLTNDSMDCQILVNLQFPPVNSNNFIKGHIESTRKETDPLHFKPLSFTASSFYSRHARESIWRMDFEIIMSLISNTLVCIFVGYQILYAKKHPSVFPFISLLMLVVLALGHVIPLMLNFEALFLSKQNRRTFQLMSGGWLEVNEVIIRVVMMAALLLQCRLLALVWSARSADGNQKASWVAEKKTAYVSIPLYVTGGLIALFLNRSKYNSNGELHSTGIKSHQISVWKGLMSYAGLILDGFLWPQILFNMFQNSRQNALSPFFYIGITLVRLLPHAYDIYRAHYYVEEFDWSYIYANPSVDYYSTAWDVIIPLVGLLFATIVYLQQLFGGRFSLPKRFKELEAYEKVPAASDAEA